MKKFLAGLFISLSLCLTGCKSIPKAEPPPVVIPPIIDPNAGSDDAKSLTWPFLFAGFLGMVGGIGMFALKKDWKMLAAGMAVALIPVLVFLVLKPMLPIVGWFCLGAGLLLLVRLAYWVYDGIEDDIKAERREGKP